MNYRATHLSRWICIFVAGLLLLGPTKQVLAQEHKGAIAGTVTDQTGAALTGAQVTIEPQVANVVSNEQGLFIINALDPGEYKVTITYVGLAPFTKTVTVAAGQTSNVDAKLQVESQNQSVLVTAPRAGAEAEAINIERSADNILQVLTSEVIRSLPNANMADALGRGWGYLSSFRLCAGTFPPRSAGLSASLELDRYGKWRQQVLRQLWQCEPQG